MKRRAIGDVLAYSKAKLSTRLVLIALASFANEDGFAWPGMAPLMKRAGLKKSTVWNGLQALERMGEIVQYTGSVPGREHPVSTLTFRILVADPATTARRRNDGAAAALVADPATTAERSSSRIQSREYQNLGPGVSEFEGRSLSNGTVNELTVNRARADAPAHENGDVDPVDLSGPVPDALDNAVAAIAPAMDAAAVEKAAAMAEAERKRRFMAEARAVVDRIPLGDPSPVLIDEPHEASQQVGASRTQRRAAPASAQRAARKVSVNSQFVPPFGGAGIRHGWDAIFGVLADGVDHEFGEIRSVALASRGRLLPSATRMLLREAERAGAVEWIRDKPHRGDRALVRLSLTCPVAWLSNVSTEVAL